MDVVLAPAAQQLIVLDLIVPLHSTVSVLGAMEVHFLVAMKNGVILGAINMKIS
jgi:hypothetical protein